MRCNQYHKSYLRHSNLKLQDVQGTSAKRADDPAACARRVDPGETFDMKNMRARQLEKLSGI